MTLLKKFALAMLLGICALAQPAWAQKYVCMQSTQGEWCLKMLPEVAPGTVANFLRYVNGGLYNGTLVHRSVPGFVIQGGGYAMGSNVIPVAVPSYGPIFNEYNRSNLRATVAMAKISGDPNSATNQWFINLVDNVTLDDPAMGSFTVFAEVVSGMSVIDKIAGLRVGDLSFYWGTTFGSVPIDVPQSATTIGVEDLVTINTVYATDVLPGSALSPYHCTPDVPNVALAEFCGTYVTFPLRLNGLGAFEVTLDVIATQPQLVFAVRPGSLKAIEQAPANMAGYSDATREIAVPSVRVGNRILDEVRLNLTNVAALQFTLNTFKERQ